MDRFQAQALIGFDGPDSHSPRSEIQAEIDRLQAEPPPLHPVLTSRIKDLTAILTVATDEGGFQRNQ